MQTLLPGSHPPIAVGDFPTERPKRLAPGCIRRRVSAPEETRLPAARTFRERTEAIARACARLGRERAADAGGAVAMAEELAP